MIAGNIYRHRSSLDLDLYIVSVSEDNYEVMYLNRHGKRLQIENSEWVRIQKEDLTRWVEIAHHEYPENLIAYLHELRALF